MATDIPNYDPEMLKDILQGQLTRLLAATGLREDVGRPLIERILENPEWLAQLRLHWPEAMAVAVQVAMGEVTALRDDRPDAFTD